MTNANARSAMDHDYIHKHFIVEKYLLGKLTKSECEAFEDVFVNDEQILHELEQTNALINGARHVLHNVASNSPRENGVTSLPRWIAVAASVAMVLFLAVVAFQYIEIRKLSTNVSALLAPQANPVIVDLMILRSGVMQDNVNVTVALPAQPAWIVLAIESASDSPRQTVLLKDVKGTTISTAVLNIDNQRLAYWSYHSSQLRPGDFIVEISDPSGIATEHRIRFTPD